MLRVTLLASLLVATGCGASDRPRPTADSLPQSAAVTDTSALGDSTQAADTAVRSAEAEDRPCFASRLGLPCR